MKKFIKEKRASLGMPIVCLMIIVIIFAFGTIVLEIMRMRIMLHQIKDGVQESTIYVMTENWNEVYNSARDGYSGAYTYTGASTLEDIDIVERLQKVLNLEEDEYGYSFTTKNGTVLYRLKDIDSEIVNTGYKNTDNMYFINTDLIVDIPVYILGTPIGTEIPMHTVSKWIPTNYR